jgi:ribosomal protein L32
MARGKGRRSKKAMAADDVAKQCPWCGRYALKDNACAFVFACGLDVSGFVVGAGCGRSWCWKCGKKFCGRYMDAETGRKLPDARESHDSDCCRREQGFAEAEFCPGGHNSHCERRWEDAPAATPSSADGA